MGHSCILVSVFQGPAQLPFNGQHIELRRSESDRFFDLAGWKTLAKIIEQEKPDIVQPNAGDTLKFVVFSKVFFRWKTSIVYRNANMMGQFVNSTLKLQFNKFLLSRASFVVSVSESCRQDLLTTFGYDENRTCTVPIGLDLSEIKGVPDDVSELFKNYPVLINVGSLVPEKEHRVLIDAFRIVLSKHENAVLIIVGKGRLEEMLCTYIQQLGLRKKIVLLGNRTDVLDIVAAADYFVMSSSIEGLPGVILEAMYCKTPVISTPVGGVPEIIEDEQTGWLSGGYDVQSIAERIMHVLALRPEVKRAVADRAEQLVKNRFSNSQIAKQFLDAYQRATPM